MPALTPQPFESSDLETTAFSSARLRLVRGDTIIDSSAAKRFDVLNATLLGVVGNKDLDAAIVKSRQLAKGSVPRVEVPQEPVVVPVPTPRSSEPVKRDDKWQSFEDIGLASKPSKAASKSAKVVVSTYRLLGFIILTTIVFVLVGYIATTVFYFFNSTWITPVAVSPSDERVVALQSELAGQQDKRDKIADDLDQAERAIAAEQEFQLQFAKAIRHDLEGRKIALKQLRNLAGSAAAARYEIRRSSAEYAKSSQTQMSNDYAAHLIDRRDMLSGKYQLAQIQTSTLSLTEREIEFQQRAAELATQTASLDAVLEDKTATTALSYDVLKIKHDYEASKLALAKEIKSRTSLKASLIRQDKIITTLGQSAYLRAVADHATVAFVPYGNLEHAAKGTAVYGCRVGMVVCREVGAVLEILPGEVTFKHPRRDKSMRGQMVELKLDDANAAEDDVLFVGGKPLAL